MSYLCYRPTLLLLLQSTIPPSLAGWKATECPTLNILHRRGGCSSGLSLSCVRTKYYTIRRGTSHTMGNQNIIYESELLPFSLALLEPFILADADSPSTCKACSLRQVPNRPSKPDLAPWFSTCASQNPEVTASPVRRAKRGREIWKSKR